MLDPSRLWELLGARPVPVHPGLLRAVAHITWLLRAQPTHPSRLDLALGVPLMDTSRARRDLGWTPAYGADEAVADLVEGLRDGADLPTLPLATTTGGPLRVRELLTTRGVARADRRLVAGTRTELLLYRTMRSFRSDRSKGSK